MRLLNAVVITSLVSLFSFDVLVGEEALANGQSETSQGANPQGRPFKEMLALIRSLEGHLDLVIQRVATLETDVSTITSAVSELEEDNQKLKQAIEDLEAGNITVNALISDLNAEIEQLNQDIVATGDVTNELQLLVDANTALITLLEADIDSGLYALTTRISQNEEAIASLKDAQISIQGQLELKQNLLDEKCAEGFELTGFESGMMICDKKIANEGPIKLIQRAITVKAVYLYQYDPDSGASDFKRPLFYRVGGGRYEGSYRTFDRIEVACPIEAPHIMGGGKIEWPSYFVSISEEKNRLAHFSFGQRSDFYYLRTRVNERNISIVKSNGRKRLNPLWEPYVIRSQSPNPAQEHLLLTVYALCAGAASNEPIE